MPRKYKAAIMKDENLEFAAQIIYRIAHDSNNILGAIEGYLNLIESQISGNEQAKNDAGEIEKAILRHSDLNKKLLSFSRRYEIFIEKINARDFCREIKKELGETIEVNSEDFEFFANKNQLKEIIHELIKNSRQAAGEQGKIELSIAKKPGFAEIKVKDNGCGIEEKNLNQIFNPFFTTIENKLGLGLAIVYGIVQRHKGKIEIETEPGQGTTISVFIPEKIKE